MNYLAVLMLAIYPIYNLFMFQTMLCDRHHPYPLVHMHECFLGVGTKKWNFWVIGCGSDILLYPALLSSRAGVQICIPEYESIYLSISSGHTV